MVYTTYMLDEVLQINRFSLQRCHDGYILYYIPILYEDNLLLFSSPGMLIHPSIRSCNNKS